MKKTFAIFLIVWLYLLGSCSRDIGDFPQSNLRAISSFSFEPYHNSENHIFITHTGVIDEVNKLITISLPPDVVLTNLRPKINLSPWTSVSPKSLDYVDFTKDTVDFVVTAESGKQAVYSVVKELNYVYYGAELYAIVFPEILVANEYDDIIPLRFGFSSFSNNSTISPEIPEGNALDHLLVSLAVSPASTGCTMAVSEDGLETSYRSFSNPGIVDFTNRVSFRITSQRGTSINYRVSATLQSND